MQQGGRLWRIGIARTFLPVQVLLALTSILTIVFASRSGDAAVLPYPLSQRSNNAILTAISQPDVDILSAGQFEGSYIVSGNKDGFLSGLMSEGALILRASAPGCGPDKRETAL